MIIQQLGQILESGEDGPAELNRLVDEFREDRDATELLELLNSASDELVRIGAWILSEIPENKYDNAIFKNRLRELTTHSVPLVRFHSMGALFPFLSRNSPETVDLIARMRTDENEGVRMAAEAAALRLGIAD